MRIAAFGDIHGNLAALEAVLADLAAARPDAAVCLGDLAFRGPQPAACVARIRAEGVPCIYGNTDQMLLAAVPGEWSARVPAACRPPEAALPWVRWHSARLAPGDLAFLASLPPEHRLEADGLRLLFVHATPWDCVTPIRPGEPLGAAAPGLAACGADVVVMGHVHCSFAFRAGALQLVNTGAVGFSQDGDGRAAYAVLDTAAGTIELRRVAYPRERAVEAARAAGFCFPPEEYESALRAGVWPDMPWAERRWAGPAGPGD